MGRSLRRIGNFAGDMFTGGSFTAKENAKKQAEAEERAREEERKLREAEQKRKDDEDAYNKKVENERSEAINEDNKAINDKNKNAVGLGDVDMDTSGAKTETSSFTKALKKKKKASEENAKAQAMG